MVDFGLSKELGNTQARRTAPGIILGTVEYVSPEGTTGESEHVDFHSDQWALAVVTYRMLSGRLPFTGQNLPQLLSAIRTERPAPLRDYVPELPEYVAAAIERAMSKEKRDRFESVQDFVRALSGLPSLSQALNSVVDGGRALRAGRLPASAAPSNPSLQLSRDSAESAPPPQPTAARSPSGSLAVAASELSAAPEPRPRILLYVVLSIGILVVMMIVGVAVRRMVDARSQPPPAMQPPPPESRSSPSPQTSPNRSSTAP